MQLPEATGHGAHRSVSNELLYVSLQFPGVKEKGTCVLVLSLSAPQLDTSHILAKCTHQNCGPGGKTGSISGLKTHGARSGWAQPPPPALSLAVPVPWDAPLRKHPERAPRATEGLELMGKSELSPACAESPMSCWQNWGQALKHFQASIASWPSHPTCRVPPQFPTPCHPQPLQTNTQALSLAYLLQLSGPHSQSFDGNMGNLGCSGMRAHDPRSPWQHNESLRQRERVSGCIQVSHLPHS